MGEGRRWLFKLKVDDIRGLRDLGMENPLCACNLARVVRRIKGRFPVSVGEFFSLSHGRVAYLLAYLLYSF